MGLFQATSTIGSQTGTGTADPAAAGESGIGMRDGERGATLHLCTGVCNDRVFRNRVIRKVHNDAAHRSAPSYGFDLVVVTRMAWQAWVLETIQQTAQLGVLLIAFALDRHAVVVAVCGIGIAYLAWMGLRAVPEMFRLQAQAAKEKAIKRRARTSDRDRRNERSRVFVLCWGGCAALAVIAGLAAQHGHAPLREFVLAAVVLAVLASTSAAISAVRQIILNGIQSGARRRPAQLGGRLGVIKAQQACNFVIYRRPERAPVFYEPTPFVGSGMLVQRWLPLAVQLLRPGKGSISDREYQVPPFKPHDLVHHLRDAMGAAGQDPGLLKEFRVADRLYVAETDVTSERSFLQSRGAPADLDEIIDHPGGHTQHYLEIQLSAAGELVTTAFVRATIRGRSLSLDFAACALTRTPEKYHVLDKYHETGTRAVLRAALRGACGIPVAIGGLWRLGEAPWILARAAWARKDRTLTPRRRRTIGTRLGIREEKAAAWDDAEIDHTAIYDDVQIIEQRVLKATEDFLESKNVDTSLFKRSVLNITSSGILNMGKLNMGTTAVGNRAQVNIKNETFGSDSGTARTAGGEGA